MKVHWTGMAAAMALVASGCVAIVESVRGGLRRARERRLDVLNATVAVLQARVTSLEQSLSAAIPKAENNQSVTPEDASCEGERFEPQTLVAITAAATAFLGKRAHIRAARAVSTRDAAGAWAQQGRVSVQTSHNLRTRR